MISSSRSRACRPLRPSITALMRMLSRAARSMLDPTPGPRTRRRAPGAPPPPPARAGHPRVDADVVARGEIHVEPDAELDERRQAAVDPRAPLVGAVDA